MTLYQFNSMDEAEQIESFWNGVFVGERKEDGFLIECRQIDDFYVEFKINDRFYTDMRSFKNPDLLIPYFDNDSLSI
jgi:hypothetical protein